MVRSCPLGRSAPSTTRLALRGLALSSLVALAGILTPAARADEILYAGDYNGNQVVRFNGSTGAALSGNPFVSTGGESVAGYGTHLLAETTSGTIAQFNITTGVQENSFTTGAFVLGMTVAQDGKSVYCAESTSVVQYSLLAGNYGTVLATAVTTNSWGVAIDPLTKQVYVNNGWGDDTKGGVQRFNANLTGGTTLVAAGDNGLKAGSGLVFDKSGTNFYAVNGGNSETGAGLSFVNEYKADGTFVKKISLNIAIPAPKNEIFGNAFGAAINSAGNIFVGSQRDNSVVEIDVANNDALSLFIGPNNGASQSIKAVLFSSQFVVPEPSSIVLMLATAPVGIAIWARRRRIPRRSRSKAAA